MTSTDLVRQDSYASASLEEKRAYVSAIAQAGDLLPQSLWTKPQMVNGQMVPAAPSPAKVLLLAETGSMLGLHPMAALTGIHIIEGKPSLSANLLGALVRRAGHRLRVTTTGSWADGTFVARAELVRSDDPDFSFVVEWTPARAKQAGLLGKGNWSKYPEAMAKARAITEVIREGAPDVTLVPAYTPEELGAQVQGAEGEVVELKQAPKAQAPIVDEPAKPAAEKPKPARKPRGTKSSIDKAKEDHAKVEADLAEQDAAAKERVKANQAVRAAEAEAEPKADLATGEIEDEAMVGGPEGDEASDELHQRAYAAATNPDNIEDAQMVEDAEQTDWEALLKEADGIDRARELYGEARSQGLLGTEINWGGEKRALGAVITELGQSFAALPTQE